jgi:hypothetical protein
MPNNSGYVYADWPRIENDTRSDFSNADLERRANVSNNTVINVVKGKRVQKKSAYAVIRATGINNPQDYVSDSPLHTPGPSRDPRRRFNQWELIEAPSETKSANGVITFQVGKARHDHDGRIARTKCYDLESVQEEDIKYLKNVVLSRHPEICLRLERNPQFPKYYDCGFGAGKLFWVIDQWEDGQKLGELVAAGRIANSDVPRIARELAAGLASLHENGVIRRELTPDYVMLRSSDQSVMLLDFELAKITGSIPSRPMDWSRSPFLAPEVDSPDVDVRADLFSWAQIVVYCWTGKPPTSRPHADVLRTLKIPKKVFTLLDSCLETQRRFRPKDFRTVLKTIGDWN